ncbi:MAG: hypothetical protein MMC23_000108 [Stictis urceolatum]|nr:hypothetical protein [Stictis urceolata]
MAENIASFGGDPDKVTIWGESAGAISVFDQTIINRGDNTYNGKALFRGAIMDSGSAVSALNVTHPKPQAVYDQVVKTAGCSGQADTLPCLGSKDAKTFANAASSVAGILSCQSLNLAYLPRPDPADDFFPISPDEAALIVHKPAFAPVPIIIGDQEDEGTLFSILLNNVTTTDESIDYFGSYFPNATRATVAGLVDLYPEAASAGSPYITGPLNELYPGFKRSSAVLEDTTFTLTRRGYLNTATKYVRTWRYLNSYLYGTPILGTLRSSDLLSIYYGVNAQSQAAYQAYYINFANDLDPNGSGQLKWPQWDDSQRQLLHFESMGTSLTTDTFRKEAYQYLLANTASFRV